MKIEAKDPVSAYLDSLSPSSKPAMMDSMEVVARFFGSTMVDLKWHELRYEQSQQVRNFLLKKYKSRTVNRHLAALRGVLKAAWRLDLMSTDDYHHAIDVKVVKIHEAPAGRRLDISELRKLINLEGGNKRDAAMISLLYAGALRRFEVAKVKCSDYVRETGQLTVRGKGNKVRQVTIHKAWRGPVEAWLDIYSNARSSDPLFPSVRLVNGRRKPMSLTNLTQRLELRRIEAGVAPFTSHDMRRTLITNLIDAGTDLVVVKRIAGHESVNTTAAYDRRGKKEEDAAIDRLEGLE